VLLTPLSVAFAAAFACLLPLVGLAAPVNHLRISNRSLKELASLLQPDASSILLSGVEEKISQISRDKNFGIGNCKGIKDAGTKSQYLSYP